MGIESAIGAIVGGSALANIAGAPQIAKLGEMVGPAIGPAMQALGLGGGQSVPSQSGGAQPPQQHPSMPPAAGVGLPPPGAPIQAAGQMAQQGGPGMPRNLPPQVLQAMGMA